MINRDVFLENAKRYFGDDYDLFVKKMNEKQTHGFFLNTKKGKKEDLLKLVDFDYESFNEISYRHDFDAIGKTKAYELGIIYPQGNEASLPAQLPNIENVKICIDLCAAPGGKSINILNRLNNDSILISNEVSFQRCQALSNNLERMGYGNIIITNKDTGILSKQMEGMSDLTILDAPCSGEGMIRKYPEILDDYSNANIEKLAELQKQLLENAYRTLAPEGQLLYSTCTFAEAEDESQIEEFLNCHKDMKRISEYFKYSFIDDTEGQFFVLLKKDDTGHKNKPKFKKSEKNILVEKFIKENLEIKDYFIYKNNDNYYLSSNEMIDLGHNVVKYGYSFGMIVKDRFEPDHGIFRSNYFQFKKTMELTDKDYDIYISGNEIATDLSDGYVQVRYKDCPLGFAKAAKGRLKNKYPKGLRRMI